MKERISGLFIKITKSLNINDTTVSTTRLQSYLILLPILIMVFVFLFIEIWSFFHAINADKPYVLSNEIIVVFGMLLSHHLGILFSRNKVQSIAEIKGINTASTTDTSISTDDATINTNTTTNSTELIKS